MVWWKTTATLLASHALLTALFSSRLAPQPLRHRPSLAAYQFNIVAPVAHLASKGTALWLVTQHGRYSTPSQRLYAVDADDERLQLTRFMLGYQIYDLLLTLVTPPLRKYTTNTVHHLATVVVCLLGLSGPTLTYWAPFFFGFIELSTLPLLVFDFFKQFPEFKRYPYVRNLDGAARLTFGVLFWILRCVLWPIEVLRFLSDVRLIRSSGEVRDAFTLLAFAGLCTALTALQIVWGIKILRRFVRLASTHAVVGAHTRENAHTIVGARDP